MTYDNICKGVFLSRPNRFIAHIEINGKKEICHVKNTSRCTEILIPGADVYVNYVDNPNRTTMYDLISVYKGDMLINIDSQAPNRTFEEYLHKGKLFDNIIAIKTEAKYGSSRFDFFVETAESNVFIEVKGVSLEEEGIAMFPGAPTERGIKHLNQLAACVAAGYEAYVVFVIQMRGVKLLTPSYKIHEAFGHTLAKVMKMGVKAIAFDSLVKPDNIEIDKQVPVLL